LRTLGTARTTTVETTPQAAAHASVVDTPIASAVGPARAKPSGCSPTLSTQSIDATLESDSGGTSCWTVVSKIVLKKIKPSPAAKLAAAIAGVAAGTASRAGGSASVSRLATATRSGHLGRNRIASTPPATLPRPKAVAMVAHEDEPASSRSATIGPNANRGARTTALPSAE